MCRPRAPSAPPPDTSAKPRFLLSRDQFDELRNTDSLLLSRSPTPQGGPEQPRPAITGSGLNIIGPTQLPIRIPGVNIPNPYGL